MLQLANKTPFQVTMNLFPDTDGVDTVFVVIKATFTLGPSLVVAPEQQPFHAADVFWGEPGASSLRYSADFHLAKPATDVALVGSAHAPGGRPADEVDTALVVGEMRKVVRVVGDRQYTGRAVGSATTAKQPFTRMPLVWERAYGGTHVIDAEKGKIKAVEENPVGQGFRARQRRQEISGQLAPNLADSKDEETPACYGFVAPSWQPRVAFAGTYDDAWQKSRAPFLPQDFDPRFFNAAHPDLIASGYLTGGEQVVLLNLSPHGRLQCTLPRCTFDVTIRVDGSDETPTPNLETVLLEPDDERLTMLWRAGVPCDKKALKVETLHVALADMQLDGRSV